MQAAAGLARRGEEGRRYPRVERPPLILSGMPAVVHDVSEGGICLHTRESPPSGQRVDLLLTDAQLYHAQELRAEVMWCRPGQVGLRWVDLTRPQQEWLCGRVTEWSRETPGARKAQPEVITWGW